MCESNPVTGRSWNLEAMLAYDKLFPRGARRLRAQPQQARALPKPALRTRHLGRVARVLRRVGRLHGATGKVLMFRDFNIDQEGQKGLDKILMIGEKFPNTTILWCHTGLARAKPGMLTTSISSTGSRVPRDGAEGQALRRPLVAVGVLPRLSPEVEPDRDDAMAERWGAYVNFINDFSEYITVGSDQVSLFCAANMARTSRAPNSRTTSHTCRGRRGPASGARSSAC